MPPRNDHHALPRSPVLVLLSASVVALLGTPGRHELLTSAIAWLAVCIFTTARVGFRSIADGTPAQRLSWAAGALVSLAQVEERAVEGTGIWWAKALVPLTVYAISHTGSYWNADNGDEAPPSPTKKWRSAEDPSYSKTQLLVLTITGLAAVYTTIVSNTATALGLSNTVLTAVALLLVQKARVEAQNDTFGGGALIWAANGSKLSKSSNTVKSSLAAVLRDVSCAAALGTGIGTLTLETFDLSSWGVNEHIVGRSWGFLGAIVSIIYVLVMISAHAGADSMLLVLVQQQGALMISIVTLFATVITQLVLNFSTGRLWFASLCAGSTFLYFDESTTSIASPWTRARAGKLLSIVTAVSCIALVVYHLQQPFNMPRLDSPPRPKIEDDFTTALPAKHLDALKYTNTRVHPVDQLVRDAEAAWMKTVQRQSKTLEEAVAEYKRRYNIPPPPHFDKWFEFAKTKGVAMIDEYDSIYHTLLPFWAVEPSTLRSRVREALGFDNSMMGLLLRDGKVAHVEYGQEWLQEAVVGMTKDFVQYLPDMDLAFNWHDEPRVVVPHDDLSRLVRTALSKNMPAALANQAPKNAFSATPKDVGKTRRIPEVKTTRFNVFAHQPVWLPSRLSCAPGSPARSLDEFQAADNLTAYAFSELGLVYNRTAFTDVCNSPSLASSHGFFDRPNAFNVVHDLFPVFSQSKMSSFQDILYPSPWYWYGKVKYKASKDMDWKSKTTSLWWRGSTTGGFSRNGGWRRQHRQQFVRKLNYMDTAKILKNANKEQEDALPQWAIKEVARKDYDGVMDVHFVDVGQCDPGDCDAQREFFDVAAPVDQQEAWKFRYLLDIDGNAFSGRFYAFLKSKSLTFKMAVFREWHEEWIKPWVHYIPLSLRGDDALEIVRYLSAEPEGKQQAIRMAEASSEWADKALRNEDFEAWFFRLLLEYGRVVDDNRESIGYSGS